MGSVSWTLRLGTPPPGAAISHCLTLPTVPWSCPLFWGKVALVWKRWHGAWATPAAAPEHAAA